MADETTLDLGTTTSETPSTSPETIKPDAAPVVEAKPTLDSVLKEAYDKATTSPVEEEKAADGGVLNKNTTEIEEKVEGKEEPSTEEKEEAAKVEADAKGPVPLERFQEVNEKFKVASQELEDTRPWADAQRNLVKFCQDNSISQEQYQYWMSVAKEASVNPRKAREMLDPTLKYLDEHSGNALPSDIEKAVANGEMTKEVAQRLAKAEANQKWGQQVQQRTAQQAQQDALKQQTQAFVNDMKSGLDAWVQSKQKDADFAPKKPGEPDGKFEFVLMRLHNEALIAQQNGTLKGTEDLKKLADKAYSDVSASLAKFAPRAQTNGHKLSSTKSSGSIKVEPKSIDEAFAQRLNDKHGIKWSPPVRK